VSFDVDGCDPSFITATGTKARCGLTERECHYMLQRIARTGNLVSFDIVEINNELEKEPNNIREVLHGDNKTILGPASLVYAIEFVLSALGNSWL
jgi:arginase family enzyme